ncbi:hypothetical protein IG631_08265 [Alternaria alternata]|nr:hypothetical protein IG631_08265 [Alternaria alternata]
MPPWDPDMHMLCNDACQSILPTTTHLNACPCMLLRFGASCEHALAIDLLARESCCQVLTFRRLSKDSSTHQGDNMVCRSWYCAQDSIVLAKMKSITLILQLDDAMPIMSIESTVSAIPGICELGRIGE